MLERKARQLIYILIPVILCQEIENWDLAIVVDVPWRELPDFVKVLSILESQIPAARIHRFTLNTTTDWQVRNRSDYIENYLTRSSFIRDIQKVRDSV